jgi:Uma2 family endonuclease
VSHALADDPTPVTIAKFDAFLETQRDDSLWELVAGRIVAMTNPTIAHAMIVRSIATPLSVAIRAPCRVFQGDVRVQRSENARGIYKPRPDVMVQCGPVDQQRNYVTDPLVIIEVLSPGTIDDDRGDKLRFYKGVPTLRHIALIYQDQMRVEHYRRDETGWDMRTLTTPDDALVFEAVAFAIGLKLIYEGVTLGAG